MKIFGSLFDLQEGYCLAEVVDVGDGDVKARKLNDVPFHFFLLLFLPLASISSVIRSLTNSWFLSFLSSRTPPNSMLLTRFCLPTAPRTLPMLLSMTTRSWFTCTLPLSFATCVSVMKRASSTYDLIAQFFPLLQRDLFFSISISISNFDFALFWLLLFLSVDCRHTLPTFCWWWTRSRSSRCTERKMW